MLSFNRQGIKGLPIFSQWLKNTERKYGFTASNVRNLTWMWPWTRGVYNWVDIETDMVFPTLDLATHIMYGRYLVSSSIPSLLSEKENRKIVGINEIDLISDWVSKCCPPGNFIVLSQVCLDVDALSFWVRVPALERQELLNDFAVLNCKGRDMVVDLTGSIPVRFATAYGFSDNQLIACNLNNLEN